MRVFSRRADVSQAATTGAAASIGRALAGVALLAVFAVLGLGLVAPAGAGGGPENLLLVVNPRSPASMTIANHYIQLRRIPSANVIYLPWDSKVQNTDIDTFRQQILKPVLEASRRRRPADQIDYVVYSSDFPWGIHLDSDLKKFEPELVKSIQAEAKKAGRSSDAAIASWGKLLTPVGSINGLTYLWQPVLLANPGYLKMRAISTCRCGMARRGPSAAAGSSRPKGNRPTAAGSSTCCRSCWA